MQSPYEQRAGELLKQKRKELVSLKKEILTENGFFGKRRLEKKIKEKLIIRSMQIVEVK